MILLNFLRNMSYFKSSPVDSILDAVLTVSPTKQYLGIFRPTTPEQTGPLNNTKKKRPKRLSVQQAAQQMTNDLYGLFFSKSETTRPQDNGCTVDAQPEYEGWSTLQLNAIVTAFLENLRYFSTCKV